MAYVIFPTRAEAGPFMEMLDGLTPGKGGRGIWSGVLFGRAVTLHICGPGQANAACAVADAVSGGWKGLVILGGCAGAYLGSGLSVGDVALADEEVYAGLGIDAPGGFITLKEAGLPLVQVGGAAYYDTFPLPAVRELDVHGISQGGMEVRTGRFLTVSTVTGTAVSGDALYERYGTLCENMEGAAAAQAAIVRGVPLIEARGISNMVVDRDRGSWDIPLASANCARVIEKIIEAWER